MDQEKQLRQSAIVMRVLGWLLVVGLIFMTGIPPCLRLSPSE